MNVPYQLYSWRRRLRLRLEVGTFVEVGQHHIREVAWTVVPLVLGHALLSIRRIEESKSKFTRTTAEMLKESGTPWDTCE